MDDWEAAAEQLQELISAYNSERTSLYTNQLLVTYRTARRFDMVMSHLHLLSKEQERQMRIYVDWRHGVLTDLSEMLLERIAEKSTASRRFSVELWGAWLLSCIHTGVATAADVNRVYEMAIGCGSHLGIQYAVAARAQLNLMSIETVEECLAEIREVNRARGNYGSLESQILALRGWAMGEEAPIDRAVEIASARKRRDSGWIGLECLVDHLGRPLPPMPGTKLLEPYEVVKGRWIQIYSRIVDRARAQ